MGEQLDRIPRSATHLFLSLGGNDALANADLLDLPVRSTGQALDLFGERLEPFRASYGHVVEALIERRLPLIVCTIYHGDLAPPQDRRAPIALTSSMT